MGGNSVILIPRDKISGTLLMNLPIVLSSNSSYEIKCDKGKYIQVAEYDKK